jgi:hypothetical protein
MPSSREVSDSIHRRERDMRRRFRDEVDTEQLHDAVGDVDEDLPLPDSPRHDHQWVASTHDYLEGRIQCELCGEPGGLLGTEEVPAADPRDLITALRNPWLWLISLSLWAVFVGIGYVLGRWIW